MKITAVESLQWEAYPRLLFVRIYTDEGLVGLGETVEKVAGTKGALLGTLAPLLLGQDPRDIEGIWRLCFDNIMYHGYSGAELRALSAVEIALWDIVGKAYAIPLYQLLGGKARDRIPTYNTCIGFGDSRDYTDWHDDGGVRAGALARSLLEDGIRAMKIWPFDSASEKSHGQYISRADIEAALGPIRVIREAVGSEMEIGIEFHFRWNRASAERIARSLEPYDILFIEDPLPAVNASEIRLLSQRIAIPVVGSELLMTRWQIRDWLAQGVSQILMTDPLWTGGAGETIRIAAMAEAYGIPLVLHNVAGPVCHALCMHIAAHIPNLYFTESCRAFTRGYFGALSDYVPQTTDGHFAIPTGPGLGLSLRPEALVRPDLLIERREGVGVAAGRRTMGDHWEREAIR